MVKIQLARPLSNTLRGRVERFEFEVGILQDKPHKAALKGLKTVAGGPARKTGRKVDGTVAGVSKSLRESTGINYLTAPWKNRNNADILKLFGVYLKFALGGGKGNPKRLENLVQAIVRNPITRGDYGRNTEATAKRKGFNRLMIDTGQFFKTIRAKVKRRAGRV